ncbi:GATA zinc finger domain-containing protein 1 [Ditylenchus destructor]|uniref:GATA zinc finger domain-containing protein 1 n=1 Tax=Ditylenchus destructor TaxID=166010 RepID=A0AAD4RAJ9_9BILA|nr:GATA zinc finger domain-containing protein 1 [Ditylenchus destructor]
MSISAAYLRKIEQQRAASSAPTSSNTSESKRSNALNGGAGKKLNLARGRRAASKSTHQGFINKYQSRRTQILKTANPFRSPVHVPRIQTKNSAWIGQKRYRNYDIIAVRDSVSEQKFFGQIRTFLVDHYAKAYAMLVWLVPKQRLLTPRSFDPRLFVHGLIEERPVPLDTCEFECSCPLIPRYMRQWSPEQLMQEQIRRQLCERVDEIRGTVKEEPPSIRNDFKNIV